MITEYHYNELRTYELGLPSWHPYPPPPLLIARGYLRESGYGFHEITDAGRAALAAFRERHGIPA